MCMVTGGANLGRIGVITNREKHPGSFDVVHVKDSTGNSFATRLSNIFVIGKVSTGFKKFAVCCLIWAVSKQYLLKQCSKLRQVFGNFLLIVLQGQILYSLFCHVIIEFCFLLTHNFLPYYKLIVLILCLCH